MKDWNKIIGKAFLYLESDYNCAENMLLAIAKDALDIDCSIIPGIATGFGGRI